jgi:hypothetical protein
MNKNAKAKSNKVQTKRRELNLGELDAVYGGRMSEGTKDGGDIGFGSAR